MKVGNFFGAYNIFNGGYPPFDILRRATNRNEAEIDEEK